MKKLLPVLVLGFLIFQSCKKIPVGFLTTEYAGYMPDSLVLKSVLDTNMIEVPDPMYDLLFQLGYTQEELASFNVFPKMKVLSNADDYRRYKYNIPWTSTPIQGLKGTAPIKIEISKIMPESSESNKLKSLIDIRGSGGILQLPLDHKIKAGRYTLSLRFSNEGWSKELQNIYTMIIE